MKQAPQNLLQGQAGVYRVAAEFCLRGLNVYFPAVDIGVDLLVEGRVRVQVKSAHKRFCKVYPNGAYWFKLGRTAIRGRRQVWESVSFATFCDFVIFWGIEENRFWVVPSSELDGHQCLVLGPSVAFKVLDEAELHELRGQGMRYEEIGQVVGASSVTVSRRINQTLGNPKKTLGARVRVLEARWDLIQDFLQSLETGSDSLKEMTHA